MRKAGLVRGDRRKLALWLACVLAICLLGACRGGGGEGGSGVEGEASVSPEATPTQEAQEGEELAPGEKYANIKDAYAKNFSMGVAVRSWQLEDENVFSLIKENFNSLTAENEMKPDYLLDQEASVKSEDQMPKLKMRNVDLLLRTAGENGMKVRGHTLVWYSQTPAWFFKEGYEWEGANVSKEVMLQRMESYIRQVLEYCQNNFPGVVYAWDVVNEAIADDSGYRSKDNLWYEVIGEEYVEKAFEYAKKYAADDVKLFYNDYNEYNVMKREYIYMMVEKLYAKGLIDGVGMQSHIDMSSPSVTAIEDAILRYSEIGDVEIQLTELDMHNTSDDDADLLKQAIRYQLLFEMLLRVEKEGKANITNVTFWGLTDGDTWLSSFKGEQSYPLLFDINMEPKLAYEYLLKVVNGEG